MEKKEDTGHILSEIKSLLNRANRNMSDYKIKYQKQLEVSETNLVSDVTENVTVSKLKKLLSKYNIDYPVYVYDEVSMQEKSVSLDLENFKLGLNKSSKSVTVKELTDLLDKLEWNNYIKIDDTFAVGSDVTFPQLKKTNRVLLSLKSLNNDR